MTWGFTSLFKGSPMRSGGSFTDFRDDVLAVDYLKLRDSSAFVRVWLPRALLLRGGRSSN